MAVLPTYTLENYQTLLDAISTGARQVQYGDKMVTYSSLDDMLRTKELMEAALMPSTPVTGFFGRRTTVGDFKY